MICLVAALAAAAFAPLGRLKSKAFDEGRLGGVAADPLKQAGHFGNQGGELGEEIIKLLWQDP